MKKPIGKLVNQAAELLQLYTRLSNADDNGYVKCVTCGVVKHYKDGMQGGHFIQRGKSGTKLEPSNVRPQCGGCNMKQHYGDTLTVLAFQQNIIDTHGVEELARLSRMARDGKKWSRIELEDLIEKLKSDIKREEKRVCKLSS